MMEKIVVTGATGFIGKHLVARLMQDKHNVTIVNRIYTPIDCDRIYHLACPSSNDFIHNHTSQVMDTILDATRNAMSINPDALFINASSLGATDIADTTQGAYNTAKRCMEIYIKHSGMRYVNYRIPSVYGEGMHNDAFIKRCVDRTAYEPPIPYKMHYIAHISEVVDAMATLRPINTEEITLGQIYELFNSGRRGLHWSESD